MKVQHNHGNTYEGKRLIGATAYSFRGLLYYHHGREHGDMLHMQKQQEVD